MTEVTVVQPHEQRGGVADTGTMTGAFARKQTPKALTIRAVLDAPVIQSAGTTHMFPFTKRGCPFSATTAFMRTLKLKTLIQDELTVGGLPSHSIRSRRKTLDAHLGV